MMMNDMEKNRGGELSDEIYDVAAQLIGFISALDDGYTRNEGGTDIDE